MIVALLFFALVSAFTAAATVMLMGFSFWVALLTYPLAGMAALLLGATLIAFGKTISSPSHDQNQPVHA